MKRKLAVWAPRLEAETRHPLRPLIDALETGLAEDVFALTLATPSECAEAVQTGAADVALVSSEAFYRLSRDRSLDVRILPHVGVVAYSGDGDNLAGLAPSVDEWSRQSGLPFVSWLFVAHDGADAEACRWLVDELGEHSDGRHHLGSHALSGLAAFVEQLHHARGLPATDRPSLNIRLLNLGADARKASPISKTSAKTGIDELLADAAAGVRITPQQASDLYERASLLDLGEAADQRRRVLHPENVVTYIIDRNVNYTNVCVTACKFCNFYRPEKSREGYTLSRDELAQKFAETVELGGIQILLQGGVNPHLPLAYYEDLFRWSKANFPLALHALSPEEVSFIARQEGLSIAAVLERLIAAGLDSLPGGGAEVLDDDIRRKVSPLKCSTETWLEVMRQAQRQGLRTTATLVFGFGENTAQMIGHLERLRALQDETAGFTAFICWPFQSEGTRLRLRDDTTALRYLRVFSLARLYLDNFPNLQVSWPTMGPTIGQVALRFGGNDFGSAMIEENVVSQAGAVFKLSADDIEMRVRAAGFVPRRRNMRYELLSNRSSTARMHATVVTDPTFASVGT